ncbi:ATP-binding protein [Bacillus salacetis]|uniref:ATP-binding protein n=1 Tax=Bacillus salacetis TaxID=2315464 RepID=UPI003BA369BF
MVLSNMIRDENFSLISLFQNIDELVFLIRAEENHQFRCIEVNQAYLEHTGMREEFIVNKTVDELVDSEEAEKVKEKYNEVLTTRKTLFYEETITFNGEKKTYETTLIPLHKENYNSYIIGISRNVSERKHYEEQLLKAKEQFQNVIHHQEGLIFSLIKEEGEFIYTLFDGQILNQMELTSDQTVGRRPQDILEETLADDVCSIYEQCWTSQEKLIFEKTDPKGHEWLTVLNPVVVNGETTAVIGSSIDITKRKTAEKALQNSEKLSLLGELSAGIGHEISNPLTSVKGFVKIMKENSSYMTPEILKVMENELENIEHFSEELIMLARPQEHQKAAFDVISLLNEMTEKILSKAEFSRAQIDIHSNLQEMMVYGVRKQIKQALFNIIENAMESMEHMEQGNVLIECELNENNIFIKIKDNGCGISEDRLKTLGEPFYTTKGKGNGLGLLITNRIIKNHWGQIEIESALEKGTTVTVSLPHYKTS